MSALVVGLRFIHIVSGVFWAGTIFFFTTYLAPVIRNLGPDGGKVMVKMFERGYLTVLPAVATLTLASGFWLLWIVSGGFESAWMGSRLGMALSTGGVLALVAFIIGIAVMRPAAMRIWAIIREMPALSEEARGPRMEEMQRMRQRMGVAGQSIFLLLIAAVTLMAVARYL